MVVEKVKRGFAVKHCSKGRTGTIATHKTKKKAMAQHRAIMISKKKKGTK